MVVEGAGGDEGRFELSVKCAPFDFDNLDLPERACRTRQYVGFMRGASYLSRGDLAQTTLPLPYSIEHSPSNVISPIFHRARGSSKFSSLLLQVNSIYFAALHANCFRGPKATHVQVVIQRT